MQAKEEQKGKNCSEGIQEKRKKGSRAHVQFQFLLEAD
jgi:hypothetical protein